jgi:catechol 1,2-dioxygenase
VSHSVLPFSPVITSDSIVRTKTVARLRNGSSRRYSRLTDAGQWLPVTIRDAYRAHQGRNNLVTGAKSIQFGCTPVATLFVLVLAGCADSESNSSRTAEPSKSSPAQIEESHAAGGPANCKPTQPDMLGPFYEPGAPVRTSVGSGYVLSGSMLAAEECKPIRNARIEFWLANSRGEYDDAHRATVLAGQRGEYRFESNVPVSYGGRPPHIHVRVTATGFEELVTQHYPEPEQRKANFDLVLVAE